MRKLGIIILFILLFGVWGLWYLGGQKQKIEAPGAAEPTIDEKLIALVQKSRDVNGRPLLDPAAASIGLASAFRITENDLLTGGGGPDETRRYGQEVYRLFQNTPSNQVGAELKLALEALAEQSPAKAAAVRRAAERYGALAIDLQQLAAPDGLKTVHLNLLNAVLGLAELDSYLAEIFTEPILALDQAPIFALRYERLTSAIMILNQVLAFHNLPLIAAL